MSISIFCKVTNFTIIFTIPLTICFIIGHPISTDEGVSKNEVNPKKFFIQLLGFTSIDLE